VAVEEDFERKEEEQHCVALCASNGRCCFSQRVLLEQTWLVWRVLQRTNTTVSYITFSTEMSISIVHTAGAEHDAFRVSYIEFSSLMVVWINLWKQCASLFRKRCTSSS